MIRHVVLMTFKEDATADDIEHVRRAIASASKVDSSGRSATARISISSTRPPKAWYALVADFDSVEDCRRFDTAPEHDIVHDAVLPLTSECARDSISTTSPPSGPNHPTLDEHLEIDVRLSPVDTHCSDCSSRCTSAGRSSISRVRITILRALRPPPLVGYRGEVRPGFSRPSDSEVVVIDIVERDAESG